jgi:hypothetical protein
LLPTGGKDEMELHLNLVTGRSNICALYQSCIYSQKVLSKMGEFVARNM